nr:heparinase II/III family protein [Clostridia bacterium]
MLLEYLAAHPLTVRPSPQFPPMSRRAAWESVAPEDQADLMALADKWRNEPWPLLTADMYAAFIRTGSRKECETPYFARRVKLCAAALHVCLTGKRDDLPIVEDGLWLICEESVWAISAHADLNADHPFPDASRTIVDLFAAQTAMVLSFVCQLLAGMLHEDIAARVCREVERRVLQPFMENDAEWWMGFKRKNLNNWTPWIVSNVMMTANIWEYDPEKLYLRACGMLDRYLACVPEDGGCDEGAGYWNMAAGAFLDCLMLLEQTADVRLWDLSKVRRMLAFPEKMHLGGGWFANFADCDARPYISGERLQYAGMKTDNAALIRMGGEMRREPSYELSDTPHLSRLLMRLFAQPVPETAMAAGSKDVWLPGLQVRLVEGRDVCISRDGAKEVRAVAAMKGGHNAENHNHNDVGSFLLAVNGRMQVVDAGNMVYTARTFSHRRYELWNCRSAYHNVPVIGKYEQQPGVQYAARDAQRTENGMVLDMAPAYPAEAGVLSCRREMVLTGCRFSVQDVIELAKPQPITWVLMLRDEPIIDAENLCCHGRETGFFIEWRDTEALAAAVEPIEITDPRMQGSYPGTLWRLTLTAAPAAHHDIHITMEA